MPLSDVWFVSDSSTEANASSITSLVWPLLNSWNVVSRPSWWRETSPNLSITPEYSSVKDTLLSANNWLTPHHSWSVNLQNNSLPSHPPHANAQANSVAWRERRPPVVPKATNERIDDVWTINKYTKTKLWIINTHAWKGHSHPYERM